MSTQTLMKLTYYDPKEKVRLTGYADTIVTSGNGKAKTLCAVRFGGYPEETQALVSAIYGGASIEVEYGGNAAQVNALTRQYSRSVTHDGPYAEATLIADDDTQQAPGENGEENPDVPKDLPPRTNYIFCGQGDRKALFDAVDQKTSAPLIPAYQDYVLDQLIQKEILRQLQVVSLSGQFEAWSLRCSEGDKNIVDILEQGLKSGGITIPGAVPGQSPLDELDSVTQYLNTFGVTVAERIKKLFVPLFDPATESLSSEVLELNDYIHQNAGYSLYDAQLAVAEAIKRQLSRSKVGLIVAECGAGKTKIGAVSLAAVAVGLRAEQHTRGAFKTFNLVLCPSHITEKWVREIQETLPDTFAAVVHSIGELNRLYALYEKGGKSCYAIVSKEKARDGYMRAPAVIYRRWNREGLPVEREPPLWSGAATDIDARTPVFCCPNCGAVVMTNICRDGTTYRIPANSLYFRREHSENHKCEVCGGPLWTVLNPDLPANRTPWVKIGDYGFVFRAHAWEHLKKVKNAKIAEQLQKIVQHPDAAYPALGARRAYALSTYVKRRYKGKLDGLIVDELHQYNNKSGQGDAMGELFNTAKKVVGMTATLINGYSSGIFHLLYRVVPHQMKKDGKDYEQPSKFDAEYGVVQNIYEEKEPDYNSNRRTVRTKKATRQLPGVSPLVYSNFLLEYAAFLSLSDMGKDLPEYEEIPMALDMPPDVAEEYSRIEDALKEVLKHDKKAARKILSAYLNLLTAYPDQPYGHKPILHPIEGYDIVTPADTGSFETLMPKETAVIDIVSRKIAAGERVLIYTNWTRLDTQRKLEKLLTEAGYRTEILHAKVKPEKREQWVDDQLRQGMQVLITNPSCVETGLDLNAFTTLIFFDTGYKLFTLRQASRRSWRINQTAPRVEVYLLYYKHTMQHKAMKLMASKLAVAGIIEGNFTEEGLAAMSECEDMTTMMAKELMLGIKDNVEDVSAAFRRMAILKPRQEAVFQDGPIFVDVPVTLELPRPAKQAALPIPLVEFTFPEPNADTGAWAFPVRTTAPYLQTIDKPGPRRKTNADENQLSLFEKSA